MAQYSARFIQDLATITEPQRQLTRRRTPWTWDRPLAECFEKVKTALSEATAMPYFSPDKPTKILVDASPVGIARILTQDDRAIDYGSRALSDIETRYSQTEREALAVVWACEHFDIYVRGAPFQVLMDHKPLVQIWQQPNPPLRIAKWGLRLQPYDVTIEYRPGHDNPADYMSRHPTKQNILSSREEKIAEDYVNFISQTSLPKAVTIEEVQSATTEDSTLQAVISMIQTGRWHEVKNHEGSNDFNYAALLQFRSVHDELTVIE